MADIYPALAAELAGDPLGRGYAGMTDAQRLASLAAPDRTRPRRLGSVEMLTWAAGGGRVARVRKAALGQRPYDALPDEARSVAIVADALLGRPDAGFDPARADHVAMIDALVAAAVLTAADKTALLELASEPCSRADELGLAGLGLGHLMTARELTGG